MPNFARAFKDEVARLARKEVRGNTDVTRRQSAAHRRDIAELKRVAADLERRLGFLESQERRRLEQPAPSPSADGEDREVRFSPKWVAKHRQKLGISAQDYGRLVGVSGLTIYNWEKGKTRPREKQLSQWAAVRGLKKREAQKRLEVLAD